MAGQIELRGFLHLRNLFRERNWEFPHKFTIEHEMTGAELLAKLDIPEDQVEVFFVNRTAMKPYEAVIHPGDRVGLAPPGVPGPYRVLLGFTDIKKKQKAAASN